MNEDYCSYELSKALKAAGFDEPCDHFYVHFLDPNKARISASGVYGEWKDVDAFKHNFNVIDDNRYKQSLIPYCSAPTLWQAQKWLRENWDLHIDVYPIADCSLGADSQVCEEWNYWTYDMHVISTRKIVESWEQYDSYEEALSEGIKSALELIKKGE